MSAIIKFLITGLEFLGIGLLYFLLALLAVLGLILILLLFILFVPIRYKMILAYDEKGFRMDGKFSYLLSLIRGEAKYGEGLVLRVKLLFFTVFSNLKQSKKKKKKRKEVEKEEIEEKKEEKEEEKEKKTEKRIEGKIEEEKEEKEEKAEKAAKEAEGEDGIKTKTFQKTEEENAEKTENEDDFFDKAEKFINKLEENKEGVIKGYEDFNSKKNTVFDFINSDGTLEGIKLLSLQSFALIKSILPKKIEGRIKFGTGDVYTEGQYLTYLCLLYGFYGEKIEIEPEWEEKVFEMDLFIKGRFRLFTILRICIKVFFNEDFRKLRDNIDFLRTRLGI